MKKMIFVLVLVFSGFFQSDIKAGYGEVNFNFFYHNLSSYGEWIEVDYDVIVWRPYDVQRNWSPYSVGNWEYTSYGWYWNSYEPYGWATYHYGRWYYDDYYGWVWVPGYEWGPSWVEWRYSDSYIGWSPLPPYADFRIRVGIYFSVNYRTSYHHWNFVSYNRFCHRNVHLHYVDVYQKNRIFNNTKYRTNYYADRGRIINGGVDRNYVERKAGSRVTEREIQRTTDLRDYTGSRGNVNSDRVVAYQPDEREVNKYRDTEVKGVNRQIGKSSLKRDVVTFRNEEQKSREALKNDDRFSSKDKVAPNRSQVDDRQRQVQQRQPEAKRTVEPRKEYKKIPERRTQSRDSYQVQKKIEQKTSSYKPSTPVKKENKSYTAPRSNSKVDKGRSSKSSSRSVSKPSNSKREVSKSTNSRSSSKKKRN